MQQQPALPVGTQIAILAPVTGPGGEPVVPAGAVGVIVARLDERSYRIRFPDGAVAAVQREDIAVRAHLQRAGLQHDRSSLAQVDLHDHIIYRCVVGSQTYGLNEPGSDVDRRGIYVPPG